MINKVFFGIILTFYTISSFSQLIRVDTTYGDIREQYYVNQKGLKEGEYLFKYKNFTQVKGQYSNGNKYGTWIYTPDKFYKIAGYYSDNEKDSIWSYYLDKKLYSKRNYKTGSTVSYFPNGSIRTKGDSIGKDSFRFMEYFKNGDTKKLVESDSLFVVQKEFDERGKIIEHIVLKDGLPYNLYSITKEDKHLIYSGNIENGNGTLEIHLKGFQSDDFYLSEKLEIENSIPIGDYKKYAENGKVIVEGEYNNGFMIGEWKKYNYKTFELDTSIVYSLADSAKRDTVVNIGIATGEVFFIVENMPLFNGKTYQEFRYFIAKSLKYPEIAVENKIQGRVFIQFSIDNTGKVVDTKIVKGMNEYLDREALRVMSISPYWRPGMQRGIPVKVQFTFPIAFVLQ